MQHARKLFTIGAQSNRVEILNTVLSFGWTVRGWNLGEGEILSHTSRPVLGPTQPPIHWVPDLLSGGKAAGVWR